MRAGDFVEARHEGKAVKAWVLVDREDKPGAPVKARLSLVYEPGRGWVEASHDEVELDADTVVVLSGPTIRLARRLDQILGDIR